jgi:hypothetical protein
VIEVVNPAPASTSAGTAKTPAAEKGAPASPTPPEGERAKASKTKSAAGKSDGAVKAKK